MSAKISSVLVFLLKFRGSTNLRVAIIDYVCNHAHFSCKRCKSNHLKQCFPVKGDANLRVPIQGALPYVSSFSSFFAFPFLWSSTCRRDPAQGFSSSTSVATDCDFDLKKRIVLIFLQTLNWAVLVSLLQAASPSTAQNNQIAIIRLQTNPKPH